VAPPSPGSVAVSIAAIAANTAALVTGHIPAAGWYWVLAGNVIAALPAGVVASLGKRLRLPFLKD
jgi:hypothetical protein